MRVILCLVIIGMLGVIALYEPVEYDPIDGTDVRTELSKSVYDENGHRVLFEGLRHK